MRPDFHSPETLLAHIAHTMQFYHPRCIDPSGGFYHFFLDDGTVYDEHTRHLVSSTRFVSSPVATFWYKSSKTGLDASRKRLNQSSAPR